RIDPTPCPCGEAGPVAEVFGRVEEVVEMGAATTTPFAMLDAAYDFADRLGTRVFFLLIRRHGLHLLIEVADAGHAGDGEAERQVAGRLGVPVTVEYLRHNDVMDRTALFRGPKIYKPTLISDWRGTGRKPITVMEALLEWPRFDLRTVMHIGMRQVRN